MKPIRTIFFYLVSMASFATLAILFRLILLGARPHIALFEESDSGISGRVSTIAHRSFPTSFSPYTREEEFSTAQVLLPELPEEIYSVIVPSNGLRNNRIKCSLLLGSKLVAEIEKSLSNICDRRLKLFDVKDNNLCSCVPTTLEGHFGGVFLMHPMIYFENPSWDIRLGGEWLPRNCTAREKIAIVIPFKNREKHILKMLNVLHPLLHRQQIHYRIFIIDQVSGIIFNKGATYNAGITEILKIGKFDCLILHDIDLLPEDDRNYYSCHKSPSHLSPRLDRHGYVWMRNGVTVGGVLAITPEHYKSINGYSNKYVGWGGEDDDFAMRMRRKKMKINRPLAAISCFSSLHHKRDGSFPSNKKRHKILKEARKSNTTVFPEGFTTVKYNLEKIDLKTLYTHMKISLNLSLTN